MKPLSKEYLLLFNAITDVEETLRTLQEKLVKVQQQSEEFYLEETDPPVELSTKGDAVIGL